MTFPTEREAILLAVLRHVPFDGWSAAAYTAALKEDGVAEEDAALLFPSGISDVVVFFGRWIADRLEAEVADLAEREPSMRRRIAEGVRIFILRLAEHREAVRRLSPIDSRRGAVHGLGAIYRVVDVIWRAAGDRATDFSFYTKRGLLAGVVTATFFYWLDDESEGYEDTWSFLDRRIEDVLRLQKLRGRMERAAATFAAPLDAWRKSPFRGMGRPPNAR